MHLVADVKPANLVGLRPKLLQGSRGGLAKPSKIILTFHICSE
jgi:hypothetical protein